MDEAKADQGRSESLRSTSPSLTHAMRRARLESAERSEVLAELRGAEMARLEILCDALKPVLAQVPDNVDLFDVGIVPGEHPRLFIDMIGFVEMGRDRRQYRFLQDTRHGRVLIVESERFDVILEATTGYIARRLVEREKALAADRTIEDAARAFAARQEASGELERSHDRRRPAEQPVAPARTIAQPQTSIEPLRPGRRSRHAVMRWLLFVIEYLGVVTLLALILGGGYLGYQYAREKWLAPQIVRPASEEPPKPPQILKEQ